MSKFLDDVISDLNTSQTVLTAYLDFQKAFDTIDHDILILKLKHCGMGEKIISLLKNYLTNRKQRTKLFSVVSELERISIGVPQGSTIGPVMFIVYINDLPAVLNHCNTIMYADDTVMYCAHNDNKVVRKKLQADLCKVQKWCSDNKLTLNVKKTKLMTFMSDYKRKRYNGFRLYMGGSIVDEVDSYRYLGTEIDNRLKGHTTNPKSIQIQIIKSLFYIQICSINLTLGTVKV